MLNLYICASNKPWKKSWWRLKSLEELCNNRTIKNNYRFYFKGSVSRVLRCVLLYINQKLFSRPIIASHNILTFLKGQFTINKNRQAHPCTMIWFCPDDIEIAGKWVFPQYWNSQQPLCVIWYNGKVLIHHIAGFMSSYCANEGIFAFQYGGNVLFPWYHLTQRSLLHISILQISIKMQKNICQSKKLSWPQFVSYQSKICTDCSLL